MTQELHSRHLDGGWAAPASGVVTITPSNSVDLDYTVRALWIGNTAGNVSVVCPDGTTAILPVAANSLVPVMCKRVNSTGTTATTIIGFY